MIKQNIYIILITSLIFISFCLGFYLDENAAGSGGINGDIYHIWRNQETFNNYSLREALNFTAVYDVSHYQSSKMPMSYILNKLFNPFSNNVENFRRSVFFISSVAPFFLYLTLNQKYSGSNKYYITLISSFLFLSPYFRTSGFWALEENYGIISVILSYYFFSKLMNGNLNQKNQITQIFLLTLFSSLCIYFDQKLLVIPIICFFSIILSKKTFILKFSTFIFYFIFSVPCFYIIYLWGGVLPVSDATHRNVGEIHWPHIAFSITIIAFYLLPLIFIKEEKIKLSVKDFFKSRFNLLALTIFFFFIIYLIFFNQLILPLLGGGIAVKITLLLFDSLILQKIFFICLCFFSFLIILIFLQNNLHDFLVIFYFIILSIIITPFYQEYLDPLIILLALTFFKTRLIINFKNALVILGYYFILLLANNIYYF